MDAIKLLKGLMGNKSLSSTLGEQLLGGLLGGGQQQQPQASQSSGLAGILGGMLGGSGGGSQSASPASSLMSGLLGSVLGGSGGAAGGLPSMPAGPGGKGSAISSMASGMTGGGQMPMAPQPQANDANEQAVLMIRAMVNAAKSDGRIDQTEQENIISKLGDDISQAEIEFLKREFAAPLDVASFARSVPRGLEQQIYAISLTSIDLDTQNEANYLGQLAQGLNIEPSLCNQIHDHLGAPKIFG